jgi:hypothetical protein
MSWDISVNYVLGLHKNSSPPNTRLWCEPAGHLVIWLGNLSDGRATVGGTQVNHWFG